MLLADDSAAQIADSSRASSLVGSLATDRRPGSSSQFYSDFGSAGLNATSCCHGSVLYSGGSIPREIYSDSRSVVYVPAEFTTRTPLIRGERLVPTKYKPRYVTAMTQHHDGARSGSSRLRSTVCAFDWQIEPQATCTRLGFIGLFGQGGMGCRGDGGAAKPGLITSNMCSLVAGVCSKLITWRKGSRPIPRPAEKFPREFAACRCVALSIGAVLHRPIVALARRLAVIMHPSDSARGAFQNGIRSRA
jgi:hypothetical protein